MIDVWVVWPTVNADRSRKMIDEWHRYRYKVGILVEENLCRTEVAFESVDYLIIQDQWEGFPKAVNRLCREVPGDIVVVVGDDVYPDRGKTAGEIGQEFVDSFPDLYGVMQPIGDKFGSYKICVQSPWIGRKFIETVYNGKGPYWEGYYHYYSDHELQVIAQQMGIFQQRSDLTQYHDHWQRHPGEKRPKYLLEAERRWAADRALFADRKSRGFPNE